MGDEYRQLHPSGGMDSAPGKPGLYTGSPAEQYGQGLQSARNISQQGSIFQGYANDPARMAEFKATQTARCRLASRPMPGNRWAPSRSPAP